MRVLIALGLVLGGAGAVQAAPRARPIKKVDRMRVVGSPVFNAEAKHGVYVWVEDGWLHVAVLGRANGKRRRASVVLSATKPLTQSRDSEFVRDAAGGGIRLQAAVGRAPVVSKFKTEGEVKILRATLASKRVPIFVGPLAARAADGVRIGRY